MGSRAIVFATLGAMTLSTGSYAQRQAPVEMPRLVLKIRSTVQLSLGQVGGILGQVRCDGEGNVYFQPEFAPLLRVSPDDGKIVSFSLDQPFGNRVGVPRHIQLVDFAIAQSRTVYAAARAGNNSFVVKFDSDGRYDTITQLDSPDGMYPAGLAVFANGYYLVSGELRPLERGKSALPYTAIFDSSGRLIRELSVRSDRELTQGRAGDKTATGIPEIETGTTVMWTDGNAYVMRKMQKPEVLVIAPTGEVLRTLHLTSPEGFNPTTMGSAETGLIVTYQRTTSNGPEVLYVVFDTLNGDEMAVYERSSDLGAALACAPGNGRFLFLGSREGRMVLIRAEL